MYLTTCLGRLVCVCGGVGGLRGDVLNVARCLG